MEAAGLAVGAVALVSIFKDCVDLFSMIAAARQLGKDADILDTKLDVERMLFLQWSERVDLLKPAKFDTLFVNQDIRQIVLRVLQAIKNLLSDGKALQKDYGLQMIDSTKPSDSKNTPTRGYLGPSQSRLTRFLEEFQRLNIGTHPRPDPESQSKIGKVAKHIRWVIVDKDKFSHLIADLSYFNNSLGSLVPATSTSALALSKDDLGHIRSVEKLDVIIRISGDEQPTVKEAAIAVKQELIQSRVLKRLWFRWRDDRRMNVRDAHFQTLHWALNPPDGHLKWDDLNTWLQKASGMYWLSGKAGSGKSTLMKFLHQHERTRTLLDRWANGAQLIVTNFFFYALGRSEQKSQSGLLRSLLHQVLSDDPTTIKAVLPNMWQEAYYNDGNDFNNLSMPSVAEMRVALKDFCASCHSGKKLCLLIDGIDEYEGQDLDVAKFIGELESFPDVKILVSSRPHPAFVTAFSNKPKMNLPDLTKRDIACYVDDTVLSHPYMVLESQTKPCDVASIAETLVDKASGVFLWVVLACRSVVEGCDDYSPISDLKGRIDELPKEVEELLQHLLDRINPRREQESMKLLNLVYANQCHEEVGPIPTFGLYLAYQEDLESNPLSSNINFEKLSCDQISAKCAIMEGMLRSRCCGLLEVQGEGYSFCDYTHGKTRCSSNSLVVFMHRTVYDLLSQPHVYEREFSRIRYKHFRSYTVLSMLWCRVIASSRYQATFVSRALSHIYFDYTDGGPPENIIRCLSILQFFCGKFGSMKVWTGTQQYLLHDKRCRRYCDDVSIVLTVAAEMGMNRVVRFALEETNTLDGLLFRPSHLESLGDCQGHSLSDRSLYCWPPRRRRTDFVQPRVLDTRFPILYHAICQPLLSFQSFGVQEWASHPPSVHTARYILAQGYNSVEGNTGKSRTMTEQDSGINSHNMGSCFRFLGAHPGVENLDPLRISNFLAKIQQLCQVESGSEDEEDPNNLKRWKLIRELISSQLQDTLGNYEQPLQNVSIMIENGIGSNFRKRVASDNCEDSSSKRHQTYDPAIRNTEGEMD